MEMETELCDAPEKSTGQLHVQHAFTCGGIFPGSIFAVSRVLFLICYEERDECGLIFQKLLVIEPRIFVAIEIQINSPQQQISNCKCESSKYALKKEENQIARALTRQPSCLP